MFLANLRRCSGLLVLLIAAAGCGKGGTVPLRGIVKLDGRPLPNATVYFIAQDSKGRDALGTTDADGVFRLSTFEPDDGAFPGSYKVIVRLPTKAEPELVAASPAEAMDAPSAGRKQNRPSVTLPPRYSQPGQTILVQDVPATGKVVFELQSE
jgi:hypothetical protein